MKRLLPAALALFAPTIWAASVTISVTPTTGIESVTPTVTWSSSGVTTCTATGGWIGAKAISGSETLPSIDRAASYGLICTDPNGNLIISWTPPTQNTNGTPLTDLAKYRIYVAATISALQTATPVEISAPATTYTVTNVAPGTKFVAVTAVSLAGVESAFSNTPSKNVTGDTATAQAAVSVTPRPKAVAVSLQ
jgi:hypothetical protein